MLRLAQALKLPTGFKGKIVVENSGEHRGTFDIKNGGLLPVVDIARFGALKAGADVNGTVERLRAASELGGLKQAHARTLEETYDLFSSLRLEHQIRQRRLGGRPPTEGKDKMGKRFAIVIGVAAAGVMALGTQTAAAGPAAVVKYDTRLTITNDRGSFTTAG